MPLKIRPGHSNVKCRTLIVRSWHASWKYHPRTRAKIASSQRNMSRTKWRNSHRSGRPTTRKPEKPRVKTVLHRWCCQAYAETWSSIAGEWEELEIQKLWVSLSKRLPSKLCSKCWAGSSRTGNPRNDSLIAKGLNKVIAELDEYWTTHMQGQADRFDNASTIIAINGPHLEFLRPQKKP